jgi:thymidylate synthase ThyX
MITAKVLSASVFEGSEIYSLQLRYPRMILAELNTHRMLAKSTSSSRAIPISRIVDKVMNEPAVPVWTKNQAGMQGEILDEQDLIARDATAIWLEARDEAVRSAQALMELGVHKQDANRLLEPFVHVDTIITGTEWENFFKLRCDGAAAPLMQKLAWAIRSAIWKAKLEAFKSEPNAPEWHLPYVTDQEKQNLNKNLLPWISAARCARVSYLNHDGTEPNVQQDLTLARRLWTSGHMSPFEHVAKVSWDSADKSCSSCIRGHWSSLRYILELFGDEGRAMIAELENGTP